MWEHRLCHGLGTGLARAWHGLGMGLAWAWHGLDMAWAWYGWLATVFTHYNVVRRSYYQSLIRFTYSFNSFVNTSTSVGHYCYIIKCDKNSHNSLDSAVLKYSLRSL